MARLPPHKTAFLMSNVSVVKAFVACAASKFIAFLVARGFRSCQPVPSPCPLAMSSKHASMMSSGAAAPKSSPNAGPAQVTAPVLAIKAICSAVKSLKPTNCVPFSMAVVSAR